MGLKIFESARYSKGHGTLESYGIWKAEKSTNAEWVLFHEILLPKEKRPVLNTQTRTIPDSKTHKNFPLLFFFPYSYFNILFCIIQFTSN